MSNSRVRIIKDPEERKQEIIEAFLHGVKHLYLLVKYFE